MARRVSLRTIPSRKRDTRALTFNHSHLSLAFSGNNGDIGCSTYYGQYDLREARKRSFPLYEASYAENILYGRHDR